VHGSSSEVTDQPSWVVKVDVEREPTLAALFDARSIPLLVLMRDGREVDRIIGALPNRGLGRSPP
jgi:thioredoxin 2